MSALQMSSPAEDSNGAILSDVPLSRYNPSFCLPLSLPSVLHALSPSPSLSSLSARQTSGAFSMGCCIPHGFSAAGLLSWTGCTF